MEEQAGSPWLQRGRQDGGTGTVHVTPSIHDREAGVHSSGDSTPERIRLPALSLCLSSCARALAHPGQVRPHTL